MRFYDLTFTPKPGDNVNGKVELRYTSLITTSSFLAPLGSNNPGALEIEFDFENVACHQLQPLSHLRIYNPPLETIQNSAAYQGMFMQLKAGFTNYGGADLPLSDPTTSGLIGFGTVFSSWANWVGTDLALDLLIIPTATGSPQVGYVPSGTASYYFEWRRGKTLKEELENTFSCRGYTIEGTINPDVKNIGQDIAISAPDLVSFSQQLLKITKDIFKDEKYSGVYMQETGVSIISIWDNSQETDPIRLQQSEFIGQPTITYSSGPASGSLVAQSTHPMRGDISIASTYVQYPDALITLVQPNTGKYGPGAGKPLAIASKTLQIQRVRHTGRFRDTSNQGWVTVIDAIYNPG